ncbi:MAG: radical SAM protein, partial [Endomicrobiia bacterium]|nr:radical SAM protein [Endomicrobiia bacterium]
MNKRNKVAFYLPYIPDGNTTAHLGPLYLAGILDRQGFDTYVFDERIDRRALSALLDFRPDIAGISVATPAYLRGLAAAAAIKSSLPKTYVVFGGAHPSALPDEAIKERDLDFVITGEAENTFPELCIRLREGDISPGALSGVKNLFFKGNSGPEHTAAAGFLSDKELDALPFPAFDKMDLKGYFAASQTHGLFRKGKRVLPLMSSRGCPNECAFCCRMMGRKMRYRSVESVIAEIEFLVGKYGVDEIYFEDDNFTLNRSRALDILSRLEAFCPKINIKFANGIRADCVDAELLRAMKRAGVYSVSFGIESGSPSTLSKMKKNLDLAQSRKNVLLAKSMGFYVGSNCIIGYPGETAQDARESLDFFLN